MPAKVLVYVSLMILKIEIYRGLLIFTAEKH